MGELDLCDEKSISSVFSMLFAYFRDKLNCREAMEVKQITNLFLFIQFDDFSAPSQEIKQATLNTASSQRISKSLLLAIVFIVSSHKYWLNFYGPRLLA